MTEADFDLCFGVNVKSVFLGTQAVVPRLISQGRGGSVVNIASVGVSRPRPGLVWYNASKGAVANVRFSSLSPWTTLPCPSFPCVFFGGSFRRVGVVVVEEVGGETVLIVGMDVNRRRKVWRPNTRPTKSASIRSTRCCPAPGSSRRSRASKTRLRTGPSFWPTCPWDG